jgi:ketosteroid isomerase-like protein
MQYTSSLSRDQLIKFATKSYFANVDRKNLKETLACFHDQALFTVQTAHTTHSGKKEIERMFVDFFASYKKIVHRDFTCTVDEKNGRIAASFIAELWDHKGEKTTLYNTNFWRMRGKKFQEVYVYMSGTNPLV